MFSLCSVTLHTTRNSQAKTKFDAPTLNYYSLLFLKTLFLALSCPIKDTSCISADGHSNVIRTTMDEAENIQECGSKLFMNIFDILTSHC